MEELTQLAGVGRKTANVVLGNAFNINEGIVVDTHVARLSQRFGLTNTDDPVKIEADLVKMVPREQWTLFSHLLIWHGRRRCYARNPDCENCEVFRYLPYRPEIGCAKAACYALTRRDGRVAAAANGRRVRGLQHGRGRRAVVARAGVGQARPAVLRVVGARGELRIFPALRRSGEGNALATARAAAHRRRDCPARS